MPTAAYSKYQSASVDFAASGVVAKTGSAGYALGDNPQRGLSERLDVAIRASNLFDLLLFGYAVDNFQSYLSDIYTELLEAVPNSLSGKQLQAQWLFEEPDIDSLRKRFIEKHVLDLGYQSIDALNKNIEGHFGLKIFSNNFTKIRLNFIIQCRNIVTHNRGIVNSVFLFKTGSKRRIVGKRLVPPDPLRTALYLDGIVEDFDRAACAKFSL